MNQEQARLAKKVCAGMHRKQLLCTVCTGRFAIGWLAGREVAPGCKERQSKEVPMYLVYPLKISPLVVLSTVANRNNRPQAATFEARNHKPGGHAYPHLTRLTDKEQDALIVLELAQSPK